MIRRAALVITLCCTGALLGAAGPEPHAPRRAVSPPSAAAPVMELTVDSIMRGPDLIGWAPTGLRWSGDSKRLYFEWRRPGEDEASTWVLHRGGSEPRQLSDDERKLAPPPAGRWDRERHRILFASDGDIAIVDSVSGARRQVTRTTTTETNPRWAREDTHVTFVRDNNVFLVPVASSAGSGQAGTGLDVLLQLTDIGPPKREPQLTESQKFLREEEQRLIEYVRQQVEKKEKEEDRKEKDALPKFELSERQTVNDAALSPDEKYAYLLVAERPEGARVADVPSFITETSYPEPIPTRPRVGDAQSRVRLAILNLETGKSVWADAGFAESGPARQTTARRAVAAGLVAAGFSRPEASSAAVAAGLSRPEAGKTVAAGFSRPEAGSAAVAAGVSRPDAGKTVAAGFSRPEASSAAVAAGFSRPQAAADQEKEKEEEKEDEQEPGPREVQWRMPMFSDDGALAVTTVRAADNKDRWIVTVDPETGATRVVDHLFDDAWVREVGAFGLSPTGFGWLPDNRRVWFLSERDGWMHLYTVDVTREGAEPKALTSGQWEVSSARLSKDGTTFYLTSSEVHPGERHVYALPIEGGARTRLTMMTGSNDGELSPDESTFGLVHSYSTRPPELFLMPNQPRAEARQITTTPTEEWRSVEWIDPELVTFRARDGVEVYARLFTPEMIGARRDPGRPGVVFVHGAGYLQNAHRYWSSYFREYMFHNLLAARGYVVLDVDYRASAGYGRDWRTAIYRHMGGKDLEDIVDGAKYLVEKHRVHPRRVGVYGGSYGGFITLMAMFTTPEVFAAGAALRPVTDWAHYNHGYTSNILNEPHRDAEAYRRSSPIYFAEGLKGALLIAHGMVDTNVHFQDSVRLAQRLIELRKENWELAAYPVENHAFTEQTSWADQYRRILKLFEENLRLPARARAAASVR